MLPICLGIIFAIFCGNSLVQSHMIKGKIIGGKDAAIENYPYQVALLNNNRFFCGGSILSEIYVLTAAHCTNRRNKANLRVRAGSNVTYSGGQLIPVADIIQHDYFVPQTLDYDISILRLQNAIKFGPTASAIKLAPRNFTISPNTLATVTGWGLLRAYGVLAPNLQVVKIPCIDNKSCKKFFYKPVTSKMLCAYEPGKNACYGDSGGPLVINGVLAGIVSWGAGNCARYPVVYARISELRGLFDGIVE